MKKPINEAISQLPIHVREKIETGNYSELQVKALLAAQQKRAPSKVGVRAAPKKRGLHLWELSAAQFDQLPEDGKLIAQRLADVAAQDLLITYIRTGNSVHVWRAYRCLRNTRQPIPENILLWIDEVAFLSESPQAAAKAEKQLTDHFLAVEYRCLEQAGKTPGEIIKSMAAKYRTSQGAMKIKILDLLGRTQRGRRPPRRR